MEENKDVLIAYTLDGLGAESYKGYLAHAFCEGGSCQLLFNGKVFDFKGGDVLIVRKGDLMERIVPSADFRVRVIYVTKGFIELSTPQSNYGMKGQIALFHNPVMRLTLEQQRICARDFDVVESRVRDKGHHFYRDAMVNAVQSMIIDFFEFHSCLNGMREISLQKASIMNRFLSMLENGEYYRHREVTYYADKLCITSKYLSEVTKKVSGYAANYWINRYTILGISRLLRDKSQTFVQISDTFGFSSPAYFSRYVQHNLGLNPSDYRN